MCIRDRHTLFRPQSFTWIGNQIAPVSERTIAIGYGALGLAVAAILLARRKASFWWVMAIFFFMLALGPVSYTHLRAHETVLDLVCRLLLEKKQYI